MAAHFIRHLAVTLAALALAAAPALRAQQVVTVKGTVQTAGTLEPIAGAQVRVLGTRLGTLTNESGAFTLRVRSANDTLFVTRIGYTPETVALRGQSAVTVQLRAAVLSLNQVVVVGYGTQRRADITGSVASIGTERLQERPVQSVNQALQGALPGVQVATTSAGAEPTLNVQIRGRNSISASTDPLVVIDGIPYNGPLSEINPQNIQSMEILKDASAAAIYGSRGSNGVILITSKKGDGGKARITYSGYVGMQELVRLPRLMNAAEFAAFKCVRLRTSPTQSCDATLTNTEIANQQAGINTDWLAIGTRQGTQSSHDFTVSGGTDDTKYLMNASVLGTEGVAVNDNFNRASVRINLDQQLFSWLTIGTATQGARTNRSGMPIDFTQAFYMNPMIRAYGTDGVTPLINPWPEEPINGVNPIDQTLAIADDINNRVFSANYARITIPAIPGLSYRMNAGLDFSSRNTGRYYGRNTTTGYRFNGTASVSNTVRNDWTLEHVLNYKKVVGRSNVDVTLLASRQSGDLQNTTRTAQGFPNDVLGYRSSLATLNVSTASVTQSMLVSQMGRLNYSFADRYLVTLTARRDGYSGFGANNKYGTFPSLALGWNISNEKFFPKTLHIDDLKLRLSHGLNGNQAINPYQTLAQLSDRSYLNGDATAAGYIPSTLGNPNLKWETTRSTNAGFDMSLWSDRVSLTLDAYWAHTYDLLLRRAVSPVQGITSVIQNIGKTANRGVEVVLSGVAINRKGFYWRPELNVSMNRNRIVDLYGDGSNDVANGWFIGQPIDVNYAYKFGGVWQTTDNIAAGPQPTAKAGDVKVVDMNGDGKIDVNDRTIIGSRQPKYIAGFSNTMRWKRFTLTAFLQSVQGVTRQNTLLSTGVVFSNVSRNTLVHTYWTPENQINTYPENRTTNNPFGVDFYEDASFVRLRDAMLSYDIPASLLSRMGGAESLRLYVNGRNLWTSTKWTGLDPELSSQRAVPLERVFTAGITVRY